ncbi:hypothetical protein ACFQVC_23420 [Streptomyces monticola]|uniref:Uncharacterized protein n=1 Tax=Streptomyces monticola TaxID=2666263 RepID=A0ABW2JP91_9ACTN
MSAFEGTAGAGRERAPRRRRDSYVAEGGEGPAVVTAGPGCAGEDP